MPPGPHPTRDGPGPGPRAGGRPGADPPPPGAVRCAVCSHESRQPRRRAAPPEQAPDLDLRPGEPLRSTMAEWLQQCPRCGYAAPDLSRAHPAAAQAVAAAPFRSLVNEAAHPPLARRFLAWAHVLEESGALHAAAEATLHAAWVADDLGKPDLARAWRLEAVALWRSGPPLDAEQSVRVADALRRAEAWEDAAHTARALARGAPPEAVAQVAALELRLAEEHDARRHTVASALPPPARRPHVTHQGRGLPTMPRRVALGGGRVGEGWLARLRRLFSGPGGGGSR